MKSIFLNYKFYSKNRWFLIIFTILILLSIQTHAATQILHAVDSKDMQEVLSWADENTLILIEVDGSLVMPKSSMFDPGNRNSHRFFIEDLAKKGYELTIAKWYEQRKIQLIDDKWPQFIEQVKAKGAVIYGLCSMPINLQNIEIKRSFELKELGVNFTPKINDQDNLIITKHTFWPASFHQGLVFNGKISIQQAIVELLKINNMFPKKIIIISSIQKDLDYIKILLDPFKNIEVKYIKFTGIFKRPIQIPDDKLVRLQKSELLENNNWLEDEEAKKIIYNSSGVDSSNQSNVYLLE